MTVAALKLSAPIARPSTKGVAAVVAAAVVVVAAAAWLLVISPRRSEAQDLKAQIASAQAQVASLSAHNASASTLAPASVRQLRVALPDTADMPQIVNELASLAAASGVSIVTLSPSAEVPVTGYASIPISVVVQGRFFSVRDVLRRLRTEASLSATAVHAHGRLYAVTSIDLQQTEPAPIVQANLTLDAFRYDAAAATAPTTTAPAVTTPASGT